MDIDHLMTGLGQRARVASRAMARAPTAAKNCALEWIADALERESEALRSANAHDCARAREVGLSPALIDRLMLTEHTIAKMVAGVRQIAALPDPVGAISHLNIRPSGIQVGQMRVPIGVIGMIYEARPGVTIDASALCLKAGNAAILRGSGQALESNRALARLVSAGLAAAGLPADAIQLVATPERAAVEKLAMMTQYVDVIVPRGGRGLVEALIACARVPMIKHLDGICHVYIDDAADLEKARAICDNAKTQRFGVCNAMETLLVARGIAAAALPLVCRTWRDKKVELRVCPESEAILARAGIGPRTRAVEADWRTEYLAPIVSIRVVDGLDAAMAHIHTYGSAHTDAIITEQHAHAMRFLREVDSASVMVNASPRFAGGFEYGLGAEIGISNDKLHARGPVGLEGLTSLKYVVLGHGEVRQ